MPRKPLIGSTTALAPFIAGQGFYSASQIIEILLRYTITKWETCLAYQAGGPLSGPVALDIGDPEQGRSRREGRRCFHRRCGGHRFQRPPGVALDGLFDHFDAHSHRSSRGGGLASAEHRFLRTPVGFTVAAAVPNKRVRDVLPPDEPLLEVDAGPEIPAVFLRHLREVESADLRRTHVQADGQQKDEPFAGTFGHREHALPHALSADV